MKKSVTVLAVSVLASVCVSQTRLTEKEQGGLANRREVHDDLWLATQIGMPRVVKSQVWTEPLFLTNGVLYAQGFRIVHERPSHTVHGYALLGLRLDITTTEFRVYTNDLLAAYGRLFECLTFDEVRTAVVAELSFSNMPIELMAKHYIARTDGIGDFSVVGRIYDQATGEQVDDHSGRYFVRGAKAIRLRGNVRDNADRVNIDVRPITKALDELLKRPPKRPPPVPKPS